MNNFIFLPVFNTSFLILPFLKPLYFLIYVFSCNKCDGLLNQISFFILVMWYDFVCICVTTFLIKKLECINSKPKIIILIISYKKGWDQLYFSLLIMVAIFSSFEKENLGVSPWVIISMLLVKYESYCHLFKICLIRNLLSWEIMLKYCWYNY
jgi:hypothetical protein